MKRFLLIIPTLIALSLAFCFKEEQNETKLSQALVEILENYHYEPKAINDDFSAQLFDLYIDRLDNDKRFFLQADIDTLAAFRLLLDDQAKAGSYVFLIKLI